VDHEHLLNWGDNFLCGIGYIQDANDPVSQKKSKEGLSRLYLSAGVGSRMSHLGGDGVEATSASLRLGALSLLASETLGRGRGRAFPNAADSFLIVGIVEG
jgi:hypothetical protein